MRKLKFLTLFILLGTLISGGVMPKVNAQTADDSVQVSALLDQIQVLLQQVKLLQDQISELNRKQAEVRQELNETIKLTRNLSRGMTGEEVKLLQEILATDPEIYPEGLVTGYYGLLTEKAVKKFQEKASIEQVGVVGPQTLAKINSLLTEGAGNSGKVPPGLLIAPGIRKIIGEAPSIPPGQTLPPGIAKKLGVSTTTPPGDEEDTTPPVISGVVAVSVTATSSVIEWTTNESANSKLWYSTITPIDVNDATYTSMLSDAALVTSHSLSLVNLAASTTYYYLVGSTDEAGNQATSSEASFTTLADTDE